MFSSGLTVDGRGDALERLSRSDSSAFEPRREYPAPRTLRAAPAFGGPRGPEARMGRLCPLPGAIVSRGIGGCAADGRPPTGKVTFLFTGIAGSTDFPPRGPSRATP